MVNPAKYHFMGKVFWVTPTDENTKGREQLSSFLLCGTQGPCGLGSAPHDRQQGSAGRREGYWCGWDDESKDWADFMAMSGWAANSTASRSFPWFVSMPNITLNLTHSICQHCTSTENLGVKGQQWIKQHGTDILSLKSALAHPHPTKTKTNTKQILSDFSLLPTRI